MKMNGEHVVGRHTAPPGDEDAWVRSTRDIMHKFFAVALLSLSSISAQGTVVPAATFVGQYTDSLGNSGGNTVPQTSAISVANSGCDTNFMGTGCWNDSVYLSYVSGTAIGSTNMSYAGPSVSPTLGTDGEVFFYYEVVGPASTTPISLNFAINEAVSAASSDGNVSVLAITYTGTNAGAPGICAYTSSVATCEGYPVAASLDETVTGTVLPNVVTEGEIQVVGGIFPPGYPLNLLPYSGSYSASIDPSITFTDPNLVNEGYSIIFSADAVPPGPGTAPEPGTAMLIVAGVAALLVSLRREKNSIHV